MILVDTSVWIDYLHKSDQALIDLLLAGGVCTHPFVIEEVALGSLARRDEVLAMLDGLEAVTVLSHAAAMELFSEHELWGRGLSAVDAHLLGSAVRAGGDVQLWTRDQRLGRAAVELGVAYAA